MLALSAPLSQALPPAPAPAPAPAPPNLVYCGKENFDIMLNDSPLCASINMFTTTPTDDPLWQLTALAAGTGGSMLSVGSIAGVTLMTMEGVDYLWYCRRISVWAALGYALGIATYQLERAMFA